MKRRQRLRVFTGLVLALLVLAGPGPVAAECTQLDPWPSFTTAARSAQDIVIGEVAESFDDDSAGNAIRFRLRVDEVLRGHVDATIEFREVVRSGLPLTICPGDSILSVRVGDHIAMAFGARYRGVEGPVTAVAFLDRNPDAFLLPGMERLTIKQVRAVADLPATDTDRLPGSDPATPPFGLIVLGSIGAWLVDRRIRNRPR